MKRLIFGILVWSTAIAADLAFARDCTFSVKWQDKVGKSERIYKVGVNPVRFGLENDFDCVATSVGKLKEVLFVDINCSYSETDRGFATGIYLAKDDVLESTRLYLLDAVGDLNHVITLQGRCNP